MRKAVALLVTGRVLVLRQIAESLIEDVDKSQQCMVPRATARGSLGEKTNLRQCIRPLNGDACSWPG
jgi:hypothetical protein